jgi:alkanesulfonate monooxygenase SsuD/methylene tetrahydromethanopterin reductase-like flavin-dependent oxidoreductase (luciferase family)
MRFGLDVAQQRMPWDEVVRRVQFAEDLGFDGTWGFDHLQPMYGEGPGETFEGMTTLAALTGVTSRIRLGLLVTGVTYRHPSVFADQALTIDHASHGRLSSRLARRGSTGSTSSSASRSRRRLSGSICWRTRSRS